MRKGILNNWYRIIFCSFLLFCLLVSSSANALEKVITKNTYESEIESFVNEKVKNILPENSEWLVKIPYFILQTEQKISNIKVFLPEAMPLDNLTVQVWIETENKNVKLVAVPIEIKSLSNSKWQISHSKY